VSTEVQESLLKSVDTGNAMVKTFVGSALSVGKSGNQPRSDFHCCTEVSHDMSCNVPSYQCRFLSCETTNTTVTLAIFNDGETVYGQCI
jgi:hypothetical protein